MKNVVIKDLVYVILVGLLVSTIAGIAVGTINYLLYSSIGISLNIFYFIGAYFIAANIRRQYDRSIILYRVLAVLFTLHGYFFVTVTFFVFSLGITNALAIIEIIYSIQSMLDFFNPLNIISGGFTSVIEYLFIFIFCYIAYTKTK